MLIINDRPRTGRFKRNGSEKKTSPKTLFRQSKAWKDFRSAVISMGDNRCEMCGMVYRGAKGRMLQVHHLDPDNYEYLDPARFSLLCASCHDTVERHVTMINGRSYVPPSNFLEWMALIRQHLSLTAREKADSIMRNQYGEKPKEGKK
jgi:hypothetical protein